MLYSTLLFLSFCMDFGIAETGIARGSSPGTTTEVLRFGVPFAEIRVVSSGSACGARADSSVGGAASSSATAAAGSSPSQDRSVDFLQSIQAGGQTSMTTTPNVLSGRINTYKLDRTTVTVGAPRILAMSTSPASAGASSCASAAATSSVAVAAGSVLP
jgi:hypothetical protein